MMSTYTQLSKTALVMAVAGLSAHSSVCAQDSGFRAPPRNVAMEDAVDRATAMVDVLEGEELVRLTWGIMPLPILGDVEIPDAAVPGAGYVEGIESRGVPALTETDGPLGISYALGLRNDFSTTLPSGVALGSTFDPALMFAGGQMIGSEARAKGFNTVLAGGANLMRDPRNGRTFEYFSEDPLLTGILTGAQISGIQSNDVISTIKHFALNGQETGRKFVDVQISDPAARESDLLAFEIAIELGSPGAVMCAYNRVNGEQGCASDYLLNRVLKEDWGYQGFVMSDWGAVPGIHAALNGLDQQSGAQLDPEVWFDETLLETAQDDPQYAERLRDMNRRVLTAIYANRLDTYAPGTTSEIDFDAHADIAARIAREGIVLLSNGRRVLPLAGEADHIALIGGYANAGTLSGGGSSQVHSEGGPAISVPVAVGGVAGFSSAQYHGGVSPLAAIQARVPDAKVNFRDGSYITDAVEQARQADIAIVFATQWMSEGFDVPDLSLPNGQDALISAVAAANPNTIVVLETGGPILMPWLDDVAAVVQAWYPGASGGEAIAAVLFGEHNPSGHLPITYPQGTMALPRPEIPGATWVEPNFMGAAPSDDAELQIDYNIEGADLGYRWNARQGYEALFPFGFGLSYSEFALGDLQTDGETAQFTIANVGDRAGADVAQLYLLSVDGQPKQRLVGFAKRELGVDETSQVSLDIDQRLLADWQSGDWVVSSGVYRFGLASDAETIVDTVDVQLPERRWSGSVGGR